MECRMWKFLKYSVIGMLRTRTSIHSGVTAPQVCNRASRNQATVVGGLSISLINIPFWPTICSMGLFRAPSRTLHDPNLLRKLRVLCAVWDGWHCHVQTWKKLLCIFSGAHNWLWYSWDSICLALIAQMAAAFDMNPRVGGSCPPQVETFSVSKTLVLSQGHPFVNRKWMLLSAHC